MNGLIAVGDPADWEDAPVDYVRRNFGEDLDSIEEVTVPALRILGQTSLFRKP